MTSILGAAASGLQHYNRMMDTTAHNLANANTDGFKAVRALGEGSPAAGVTPENSRLGVATTTLDRQFRPGSIRSTGDPLHFAIQDGSFIRVQGDDGAERFTRQGGLSLDGEGNIVAQGGRRLEPPMQLPEGATSPRSSPTAPSWRPARTVTPSRLAVSSSSSSPTRAGSNPPATASTARR
ncbi:MAG: flagellar hook-basal body complex protein [Dehalococcoidia bacterium]|nr:flagellar hook-basal body complex protein [Dehalococcoidia bacterium]